jgi:nitrous oxidase accessory protein NosD
MGRTETRQPRTRRDRSSCCLAPSSTSPSLTVAEGGVVYVRLVDSDRNGSGSVADTVHVRLRSDTESAGETVVLTETGVNTGIFAGQIGTQTASVAVANDGTLQAQRGDKLTLTYRDPANDFGQPVVVQTSAYYGVTLVSGTYSANTTWRKADSPFLMTGDVTVNQGSRLTIEPGVRVLVTPLKDDQSSGNDANRVELRIHGQLVAEGTEADSIKFASLSDVPASSDWYGINLDSGNGVISIANNDIRHATHGIRTEWGSRDALAHFKVLHSTFDQVGTGLYLYGLENIRRVSVEYNTFRRVNGHAVYAEYMRQADLTVIGNRSEQSSNGSIQVSYVKSARITDNVIATPEGGSVGSDGIVVSNISELTVQRNTLQRKYYGLIVYSTPKALIRGNLISNHAYSGIYLEYTSALVDSNVVRDNGGTGIFVNTNFEQPTTDSLRVNTITGNGQYGIHNSNYARTVANYNNIHGNFSYDYYNDSSAWESLDARFNWWGTNTTAVMNAGSNPKNIDKIYDRYDNNGLAFVNYAGWLDGPDGNTTAADQTGQIALLSTSSSTTPSLTVAEGGVVYVRLVDGDRNASGSVADTVHVRLTSDTESSGETVVLTETGVNTGIFAGQIGTQTASAAVANNGTLQAQRGDKLTLTYRDPANDFGQLVVVQTSAYYGVTLVSGTYSANTTWRKADSPFLMTGDVTVNQGSRLTIEPGVRVLVTPLKDDQSSGSDANRVELRIQGQLVAEGTEADSIKFASLSDVPASSDWYGINVSGSGVISIANNDIRHATHGIRTEWGSRDALAHFKVLHSTFDQVGTGLYLYGLENIRRVSVEYNTFRRVNGHAVYAEYMRQADLTVIGNRSEQSSNGSIQVSYVKSARITDNVIATPEGGSVGSDGIVVSNISELTVQRNTLQRKYYGLIVYSTPKALIRGNLISNHAYSGIYLEYTSALVDSNVVRDNGGTGIFVHTNFERPTTDSLRVNTITGNGQAWDTNSNGTPARWPTTTTSTGTSATTTTTSRAPGSRWTRGSTGGGPTPRRS